MRPASSPKSKVACLFALALCTACGDDQKSAPGFESDFDPSLVPDATVRRDAGVRNDGGAEAGALGEAGMRDGSFNNIDDAAIENDASSQEGQGWDHERLLLAEANRPRVYAFDLLGKEVVQTFDLAKPARVYAGSNGRVGFMAVDDEPRVLAVDLGLARVNAAGSARADLLKPALLDKDIAGSAAQTPVSFGGKTTLFFPGDARAVSFDEATLLERFMPVQLPAGAAHAGVAVPFKDGFLVSALDAGQSSPTLVWHNASGARDTSRSFACSAPRAAARNQDTVAVACSNGVLHWRAADDAPRVLAYPAGVTAISKLVAHPVQPAFFALAGDRLCVVEDAITCVAAEAPVLDIAISSDAKRGLVLARDGVLYTLDPILLTRLPSVRATSAVADDTAAHALPAMAVGRSYVYVTDPAAKKLRTLHAASATQIEEQTLLFAPSDVALFRYFD